MKVIKKDKKAAKAAEEEEPTSHKSVTANAFALATWLGSTSRHLILGKDKKKEKGRTDDSDELVYATSSLSVTAEKSDDIVIAETSTSAPSSPYPSRKQVFDTNSKTASKSNRKLTRNLLSPF
jgi:hypothetical protein